MTSLLINVFQMFFLRPEDLVTAIWNDDWRNLLRQTAHVDSLAFAIPLPAPRFSTLPLETHFAAFIVFG